MGTTGIGPPPFGGKGGPSTHRSGARACHSAGLLTAEFNQKMHFCTAPERCSAKSYPQWKERQRTLNLVASRQSRTNSRNRLGDDMAHGRMSMTDQVVARRSTFAPNTSDSEPALVHLAEDARAAGISKYHARQLAAAGKVPAVRLGAGDRAHIFTVPGACRAAIDADLKRG